MMRRTRNPMYPFSLDIFLSIAYDGNLDRFIPKVKEKNNVEELIKKRGEFERVKNQRNNIAEKLVMAIQRLATNRQIHFLLLLQLFFRQFIRTLTAGGLNEDLL